MEDWKMSATSSTRGGKSRMIWWCMKCGESCLPEAKTCLSCAVKEVQARLRRVASERDRLGVIADVFHSHLAGTDHGSSKVRAAAFDLILMSQERWSKPPVEPARRAKVPKR